MNVEELLGQRVGDMTKSEPLPEGVYHIRVVKAEVREPKEATNQKGEESFPYVNYDYVVCGDSPEEFHGRHVFEIGTLKPGATFVNRQVLEAAGFDEDTTLADALPELPDREFLVALTIDGKFDKATGKWEGKKGADGKWYEARNKVTKRMALGA